MFKSKKFFNKSKKFFFLWVYKYMFISKKKNKLR